MNVSQAMRADGRVSFVTREGDYVEDLGDGRRLYEPTIPQALRMAEDLIVASTQGQSTHNIEMSIQGILSGLRTIREELAGDSERMEANRAEDNSELDKLGSYWP